MWLRFEPGASRSEVHYATTPLLIYPSMTFPDVTIYRSQDHLNNVFVTLR
jgi:hypothetical protein